MCRHLGGPGRADPSGGVGGLQHPQELGKHTTLSMSEDEARQRWELHGANGEVEKVDINPSLMELSFSLLHQAALKGIGIALLPQIICCDDLKAGRLQKVLPEWNLPLGICHAVFPSRRGLLPAVRVFIDFLSENMPAEIQASKI